MRVRYFGDSYDIVKQSLLRWLAPFGDWAIHPMFTEEFEQPDIAAFADFLGSPVLTNEVLSVDTDREAYLSCIQEQHTESPPSPTCLMLALWSLANNNR